MYTLHDWSIIDIQPTEEKTASERIVFLETAGEMNDTETVQQEKSIEHQQSKQDDSKLQSTYNLYHCAWYDA